MKKLLMKPYVSVPLITLSGALLRIYHLGFKCLWLDEAVTYWNAQGSISEVIFRNSILNSAPPTFAVLLHFLTKFGDSEYILRAIPCLAGIAAIPLIYKGYL